MYATLVVLFKLSIITTLTVKNMTFICKTNVVFTSNATSKHVTFKRKRHCMYVCHV